MNKTRVDDMLIEMIEPKIQEINKKFTSGESLTQDDINTLLLKSQYNHINHLDEKLNEVTADVASLKVEFKLLKQEVKHDLESFRKDNETFKQEIKAELESFRKDNETFKQEIKAELESFRKDNETFKQEIKADFKSLEERIETTIQKALNKNMMTLIIVIGLFMTLSKVIDKF